MYPVSKNWKKHNKLGKNLVWGMKKAGVKIYGSGSMAIDLTQTSYSTIASVDLEVGDNMRWSWKNFHDSCKKEIEKRCCRCICRNLWQAGVSKASQLTRIMTEFIEQNK